MSKLSRRVKDEGNPLINGNIVTFVWKGKNAPYLNLESNGFESVPLQKISEKVWKYTTTLPDDAYIEYNFTREKNDPDTIVSDRYNSKTVDTGLGHDNHYFSMPGRKHTELTLVRDKIKRGKVTYHRLPVNIFTAGKKRKLWLYHPPVKEAVPLLLVLDGKDYKERGHIVQIVDNLIADKRIQPIAMAMIDNAGKSRMLEYNQSDNIPMLVMRYVLPFISQHLNLIDYEENPGAYGVLGASMGGLMALYTGLRLPDIFGKVISQSGAFLPVTENRPALIHTLIDSIPVQDLKIWMDCGVYEYLIDLNRAIQLQLIDRGYEVIYRESNSGHNYTSWRDFLPDALESMFGV